MNSSLTTLEQIRDALSEAKGLTVQMAAAAAADIDELEAATVKYVNGLVGDIAAQLDVINGEVV